MVKKVSIGVLGIQGAISEHVQTMEYVLKEANISGEVFIVKHKKEIDDIDALILPGGESTTISKIIQKNGIHDTIFKRIQENSLPIMGTCAGCVLLGKEIIDKSEEVKALSAMDMEVERNAFGRQTESFERNIDIKGFSNPYTAVFIRAPVITKIWGNCEILCEIEKKIVMARQGNYLALSFHPELTSDLRIHKYFLNMVI